MNSKSQKQQIQWPPILQMMRDEPCIDNTFRNVEKINAPYINDMVSPVWVKDTESVGVYDIEGHRYEINDGWLTRDGTNLFEVEDRKFVREDVTEQLINYHDYDMSDLYEAYTTWNTGENSFNITFNEHTFTTQSLYTEGVVVSSRIRIIDRKVYFVAYYDIDDRGYVCIVTMDHEGNAVENNKIVVWYKHQIRRNATSSAIYSIYDLENANPLINIGKVDEGVIGISLVSAYGKAINSSRNYFATYFITDNGLYQLAVDARPTSETSTITVTDIYTASFKVTTTNRRSAASGSCISSDGTNFFKYETEGVKGEAITFPVTYTPVQTETEVTIDGTAYTVYDYSATAYYVVMKVYGSISSGDQNYTVKANYNGSEYTVAWESGDYVNVTATTLVFRGETVPPTNFEDCTITWMGEDTTIPNETWNLRTVTAEREGTSTVNAGWLVSPNVVLDDGSLASFWGLDLGYADGNNWNNQTLANGSIIEESGVIISYTEENDEFVYTISPTEYVTVTSDYNVARSNSFALNQNLLVGTVKLNNASATSSYSLNAGTAESTSSKFLEYVNSNATDLRYYPGTIRDATFNYWGDYKYSSDSVIGAAEDQPVYTVQGFRTPVHGADRFLLGSTATPFNILYNVDASNTCLPQGISFSLTTEHMGTLLTPWQSIDDDFYIVANSTSVVYRDKSNRYYKISITEGNNLVALLDDRYILVNTTSYWNMYDSQLMKKFHYATDYNDRVMFGQTALPASILAGANSTGTTTYTRYTATAINAAYSIMPMFAVSSMLLPVNIRTRVAVEAERPFRCYVEEAVDTQPIDIYYGNVGALTADYRYSLYPYYVYDRSIRFDLVDSSYVVKNTSYLSPNIFTEYISGAGNNDMVKETYSTYVLNYYDQTPFFLYSSATEVSAKNKDDIHFFVLQGQFYAFMNEKIYSMIYSNGAVSSQDAIIDARGMKFIGNNPQIAFFWSPRNRAIYSFTGDANLQHIYNADKFTTVGYDGDEVRHWYDETTQSIYCATDAGLLVFGPNNQYLFEEWKNVTNCQFTSDNITHITDGDTTISLVYYPTEGYEQLPLNLETAFYGLGDNEYTAIDRWDIVLVDKEETYPKTEITVGVRTITDITVKSEEKTLKITPDMWDKWSHSVLIRYVPKLQKGQGIRLYLKTPMIVQRITPHIMDMGTGTLTKRGV